MQEHESKKELKKKIEELSQDSTWHITANYLLNGALSIVPGGGFGSGLKVIKDKKVQAELVENILKWMEQTDQSLEQLQKKISIELNNPTKASLHKWLSEITPQYADVLMAGQKSSLHIMLNQSSVREMEEFMEARLLSFVPTHNSANMGAGNVAGGAIEEKKRPYGQGQSFIITIC